MYKEAYNCKWGWIVKGSSKCILFQPIACYISGKDDDDESNDGAINDIMLLIMVFHCMCICIYSASQKKRNRELSMFDHNLITFMINKWHIFGKLRSSSFIWCNSLWCIFHAWVIKINLKRGNRKVFWWAVSEFQRENHISRKLCFCPFIWHLNQEKWARNDKVLFV